MSQKSCQFHARFALGSGNLAVDIHQMVLSNRTGPEPHCPKRLATKFFEGETCGCSRVICIVVQLHVAMDGDDDNANGDAWVWQEWKEWQWCR